MEIEHVVVGGPPRIEGRASVYLPGVGDGPYAAMNAGAKAASGDLLAFLGAGDTFTGPASARALAALGAEHAWGYGRLRIVDVVGRARTYAFRRFSRRLLALAVAYVPHPGSVMRASLLDELGGFNEAYRVIADQELFIRASRVSHPGVSDDVIAEFHTGGLSTRSPWAIARDFETVRRDIDGPLVGSRVVDRGATLAVCAGRATVRTGRAAIQRLP